MGRVSVRSLQAVRSPTDKGFDGIRLGLGSDNGGVAHATIANAVMK
jgi:hypothetical protein